MIKIRQIKESDAESFLTMMKTLDNETKLMMYESNERKGTVEKQEKIIKEMLAKDNQMIFVAEDDGWLVGFLGAYGGEFQRTRHRAHIVVGIIREFWGRGVGKSLFLEMEKWARSKGIHRLELTVMGHNERGIRLYQKMGFEVEGTRHDSLLIDGEYVDEYSMYKLLKAT
jgi:RimJ/RimL family protein N-acetyltransferase